MALEQTVEIPGKDTLPRVTKAEIEAARQNPVVQELSHWFDGVDWNDLGDGLTKQTLTMKDIRAMRLEGKYGT